MSNWSFQNKEDVAAQRSMESSNNKPAAIGTTWENEDALPEAPVTFATRMKDKVYLF
jgi:hypothetical protein